LTIILFLGCFAVSAILTGLAREYAIRSSLLDIPNVRSSHQRPTPTGGGLAMAVALLGGWAITAVAGLIPVPMFAAIVGGGLVVACVGWIDDRRGLTPMVRMLAHTFAAIWAVAWLGGVQMIAVGSYSIPLGWAGSMLAVVGMVWLINLYNFMDGIDGLAAGAALSAGTVLAAMSLVVGDPATFVALAVLIAASGGFLPWNWEPARIFMGDVGSGLMGFSFAALAIASEIGGGVPLLAWLVTLGVFVFDATTTLLRRVARGERWYEAHRTHAYQRASQLWQSHARVARAAVVLTLMLGGAAALGVTRPPMLPLILAGAVVGLSILYLLLERVQPMRRTQHGHLAKSSEPGSDQLAR
jgi:Fuc2NAc and GlcNAc transferase